MSKATHLVKQAKEEAKFFDEVYTEMEKEHSLQKYIVPDGLIQQIISPSLLSNDRDYCGFLLGNIEGKKILDYGAGDGWNTICFAKGNGRVWAIDISAKGIDLIKKKAKANGVSELITAEVKDCYNTGYPDNMFDIIYGGGILHHLDIESAGQELNRILKPSGVAVFREPIKETMIMDVIKKAALFLLRKKPSQLSEGEAPFKTERVLLLKQFFEIINLRYFEGLSSINLLFRSNTIKNWFLRTDYQLMKSIPALRKLGRTVIIELRSPVNKNNKT